MIFKFVVLIVCKCRGKKTVSNHDSFVLFFACKPESTKKSQFFDTSILIANREEFRVVNRRAWLSEPPFVSIVAEFFFLQRFINNRRFEGGKNRSRKFLRTFIIVRTFQTIQVYFGGWRNENKSKQTRQSFSKFIPHFSTEFLNSFF